MFSHTILNRAERLFKLVELPPMAKRKHSGLGHFIKYVYTFFNNLQGKHESRFLIFFLEKYYSLLTVCC